MELEKVSFLVELEDRSALALLKDGSFVRTIILCYSVDFLNCISSYLCNSSSHRFLYVFIVKPQRGFNCEVCPQGGDFDRTAYPQGGRFNMATILDNEEGLEINLVPKAFPSPGSAGKALGTRLPKNNFTILENTRKAFK